MTAIAVTIAGSDSGGGAGIQADLKTFSALGVYGASVITALTAQNTKGVTGIHDVPPDFIAAQIDAVIALIRASATVEDAREGLIRLLDIDDVQETLAVSRATGVPITCRGIHSGDPPRFQPSKFTGVSMTRARFAHTGGPNEEHSASATKETIAKQGIFSFWLEIAKIE
jgi:hydroxymethylpyrimidine/phosphomethylpyrimidine kinase